METRMDFEIIDIVFAVLVLLFCVRCVLRGFVEELMSMASVVLGLFAAFSCYQTGGRFVRERFMPGSEILPLIIAFVCLFLIVCLAVKLLAFVLKDIVNRINLAGVDKVLGGVFGVLEGLLLVCLTLFVLSIQPLFDAGPLLAKSLFARYLLPLIGVVAGQSPAQPFSGSGGV
jgi:membrane protein required for colicin V production